jgi:formylglycine-generating enzyme required for sulfatase activity
MKFGKLLLFFALWGVIPIFAQRIDTVWMDSIPIEMVFVEGGTFEQGCMSKELEAGQCQSVSQPEHTVTLKSYYIAKFEVTRELYRAVMGVDPSFGSFDYRPMFNITPKCPVQMVSWFDTQAFMDSLFIKTGIRFRLPTEAEWEYAARGGLAQNDYLFSGSNDIDEVAYFHNNFPGLKPGQVFQWEQPVGGRNPNALGLYDMTCNVEEWCSDWFSEDYYSSQTTFKNPKGPSQGSEKVCRGGSWGVSNEKYLHLTYRCKASPDSKQPYIGFRLAMDAEDVKR